MRYNSLSYEQKEEKYAILKEMFVVSEQRFRRTILFSAIMDVIFIW